MLRRLHFSSDSDGPALLATAPSPTRPQHPATHAVIPALPLLCESCGYTIDGLPTSGDCPECGRSITSSLPDRRIGSPWQRRPDGPTWREWQATARGMLFSPVATFDQLRIDGLRAGLQHWNLLIASFIGYIWCLAMLMDRHTDAIMLLPVPAVILVHAIALRFLAAIERRGMQVIAKAHRWRIDEQAARSILAHASFGWLTGGLVATIALVIVITLITQTGWLREPIWVVPATFLGAWFLGLLHFETLVYIGLRRCKYANRAATTGAKLRPGEIAPTVVASFADTKPSTNAEPRTPNPAPTAGSP